MRLILRSLPIVLLVLLVGRWSVAVPVVAAKKPAVTKPPHTDLTVKVLAVLKARCGKCHGSVRPKGKLELLTLGGIARGGEDGTVVLPGKPGKSLLWQRVHDEEMPPDDPLPAAERKLIQRWITAGAPGLADAPKQKQTHWSFRHLSRPIPPAVPDASRVRTPIDRFILAKLSRTGLSPAAPADRSRLIRRVSFDLTGLPPTPAEIDRFLNDHRPGASKQMVERYLASSAYGKRWGGHWLDTAGYADSNGYFNADTDRPLAYRYRDYVIRSFNADKPFDRFIREQLAGDELAEQAGYRPGEEATPQIIDMLEATHFLRNAQDGTDSSDGNDDERRTDKYKVLEGTIRILGSSLFGLKLQCARCHEHKFEPIEHREYYQLQAILYPAFNIEHWVTPKKRFVYAAPPGETDAWKREMARLDEERSRLEKEFADWIRTHPERRQVLFRDTFEAATPSGRKIPEMLLSHWSNTVPGDKQPAGTPAIHVGSAEAPGVIVKEGGLRIVNSNVAGYRVLSTRRTFDWTPDKPGAWIQVSFDLVADRVDGSRPAIRIGYEIALHDFNDRGPGGGNVLIDGNPSDSTHVYLDYPGADSRQIGTIGSARYRPGHNFGVRVTNIGKGKFRLEHLVDHVLQGTPLTLSTADLPDGGFGFEHCCGRTYIIDNVLIEQSDPSLDPAVRKAYAEKLRTRQNRFRDALKAIDTRKSPKPGKLAWVTDASSKSPDVYRLIRGNYKAHGEKVQPAPLAALSEPGNPYDLRKVAAGLKRSTGCRLAFARWLTHPNSRASALLARVTVNRIWQHHLGTGIVRTADNLGYSGASPSHPELLDWLASYFVQHRWSVKAVHRLILNSAVYQQSSVASDAARRIDPDNRWLSRFSLRRLDAEAIRDSMLFISDELDQRPGGPYVPTRRLSPSQVVVEERTAGARRRSIYLQHRRTQGVSLLKVFDAPTMVFNCTRRDSTTIALQSLSMLNSDFVRLRSASLAARLNRDVGTDRDRRITRAFRLITGRTPSKTELAAAQLFLDHQPATYPGRKDAESRTWIDFCQMLLASNAFLYVE